jgi:His/Glu/Gln/Arg/opine family amino acid ABC transporter permease subunit
VNSPAVVLKGVVEVMSHFLAVGLPPWIDSLWNRIYDGLIVQDRYMYLVKGLGITLFVTLFAGILGFIIGLLIAVIKVLAQNNKYMKPFEVLANIYLTVIRGTPMMVQLLIIYFVILASVDIPKEIVAVIAFGINSGAYVAETIRAGILAVDKGQAEAGRSLGLPMGKTYRFIILPQAFKNILPALGNEYIALLKETAIVGYIALVDLTKAYQKIATSTYDAAIPLYTIAIIYLIIVLLMTAGLNVLERRLRKSDNR